MKSKFLLIALCLSILIGCQNQNLDDTQTGALAPEDSVIRAANGSLYSVSCLRENVDEIHEEGRPAVAQCKVDPATGEGRNFMGKKKNFFILWPPAYYSVQYQYTYYPKTTYSTYPTYPSNYTPSSSYTYYQDGSSYSGGSASTTWNQNPFWSWAFNRPTKLDGNKLFDYGSTYSSYYQPTCIQCINSYSSRCQNRCVSNHVWTY